MEILSWTTFLLAVVIKAARRERVRFPLAVPLIALIAVVAVGLLLNPPLRPFWFQFGFMRWVFLLWGLMWAFELVWSPEFEKHLIRVWMVALAIASAYAVFQTLTGIDFIHPHTELMATMKNVAGRNWFYRANGLFTMTLTFAYVAGISFWAIFFPSARFGRTWMWASRGLGALGVIAAMSRGAWFSLIFAGFVYLAVKARRFLPHFLIGAAALLIGLSFVSPELNETLHFRLEHSSSERVNLWRAYWAMFTERPWFGVGISQGDRMLTAYYDRLGIQSGFMSHAHNTWLQWLAGGGVFALGLYLWISGALLVFAWRLRGRTPWGWSLVLAQLYWHLGSLTENSFFDGEVTHMIVFTWALVLFLRARTPHATETRHLRIEL